MRSRMWMGILAVLLLLGLVAGVGALAYNAGVSQGMWLANNASAVAPNGTVPPTMPYAAPWMFHPPFGFGFGLFACFVPFLFLLTFFVLLRFIFGGPRWHRHWGGPGMRGEWNPDAGNFPPHVAEWHRKLHEQENAPPPSAAPAA